MSSITISRDSGNKTETINTPEGIELTKVLMAEDVYGMDEYKPVAKLYGPIAYSVNGARVRYWDYNIAENKLTIQGL